MTALSVNLNKIALLRNSRGGQQPGVLDFALQAIRFGAQGITVHPRPDGRHIRRHDVYDLKDAIDVELNVEGFPAPEFNEMVMDIRPAQVTLVPDDPGQLTSDHGWDVSSHTEYLKPIVAAFRDAGMRVSLFMDPDAGRIAEAAEVGADRVELYTESYAKAFGTDAQDAVLQSFIDSATAASDAGLALNAGHDLNQQNLGLFCSSVSDVLEVSIGHALISEALVDGWETTIRNYLSILEQAGA